MTPSKGSIVAFRYRDPSSPQAREITVRGQVSRWNRNWDTPVEIIVVNGDRFQWSALQVYGPDEEHPHHGVLLTQSQADTVRRVTDAYLSDEVFLEQLVQQRKGRAISWIDGQGKRHTASDWPTDPGKGGGAPDRFEPPWALHARDRHTRVGPDWTYEFERHLTRPLERSKLDRVITTLRSYAPVQADLYNLVIGMGETQAEACRILGLNRGNASRQLASGIKYVNESMGWGVEEARREAS